jgi:type IV pilus assembly protein PilQ
MRESTRTAGVLVLAAAAAYAPMTERVAVAADPFASVPVAKAGDAQAAVPVNAAVPLPSDLPSPVELVTPPSALKNVLKPAAVAVSDFGTVTITVQDAPLAEVLKLLAQQSQKNIIASKGVTGTVTASLYDVTLREALEAMLKTNGLGYREQGNFIYVYTEKELEVLDAKERKQQTKIFRVYYTSASDAVNMVKPVLSADASVSFSTEAKSGLESGTTDMGGMAHSSNSTIVVTDFPENLEKMELVLKEIDKRPQQVLIEATILRASLSEDNALGVDFNILAGVNFSEVLNSAGQIVGGDISDGDLIDNLPIGGLGTGNNFSSGISDGFKFGLVSDNVSVFIAALEGATDATVLANPKVLALNTQRGEIIVGRRDGYLTTTVTDTSTVQTVEFLDTGTRLIFRPFIGDDGYVRMEIHPEDSSGGLTADANLPFKITTEVTSNIMVKDGHTIVIGGLFREASSSARSQVPLLGSIPLAGQLFRNQRDRSQREEIVILLTPHIIKDDSAYAEESEQAKKDAERMRVGVRRGMMPWGRERMAESSFEQAVAELAKPEPDRKRALWHLNIATNLNPLFFEAIKLKEQLTGEELDSVDNSSIRGFVRKRIMAERERQAADVADVVPILSDVEKKALRDKEVAEAAAQATPSLLDKPLAPKELPTRSLETPATATATKGAGLGGMFRSLFGTKKPSAPQTMDAGGPVVEEVIPADSATAGTSAADTATADLGDGTPVMPPVDAVKPETMAVPETEVVPSTAPSAPTTQPISIRSETQPAWGALRAAMEARQRKSQPPVEKKPEVEVVTVEPEASTEVTPEATPEAPKSGEAETTVTELP